MLRLLQYLLNLEAASVQSEDSLATQLHANTMHQEVPPFFRTPGGALDTICFSVEVADMKTSLPQDLRKIQTSMTHTVPVSASIIYLDYKLQPIYSESLPAEPSSFPFEASTPSIDSPATFFPHHEAIKRKAKKQNANLPPFDLVDQLDDGSIFPDESTVATLNTLHTMTSQRTNQTNQTPSFAQKIVLSHFDRPTPPPPAIIQLDLSKMPSTTFAAVIAIKSPPQHPLCDCGVVRTITYSSQTDSLNPSAKHISGWSPVLFHSCLPAVALYRAPDNSFAFQPLLPHGDASSCLAEAASLGDSLSSILNAVTENGAIPLPHLHIEVRRGKYHSD